MDHLGKEALKTQLQPSNYNSDGVLCQVNPGMTNTYMQTHRGAICLETMPGTTVFEFYPITLLACVLSHSVAWHRYIAG